MTTKISIPVSTMSEIQPQALDTMSHANKSEQDMLINGILDILRTANARHTLDVREDILREIAERVVSTGNIHPSGLSLEARLMAMKLRLTISWNDLNDTTESVARYLRPLLAENQNRRSKRRTCTGCTNCCNNNCFPARATVMTNSGEHKSLHELKVGEKISCVRDEGQQDYCEVIGFLHKQESGAHDYLSIHTDTGHKLEVSASHLIFRSREKSCSVSNADDVFASEVTVGDYVYVTTKKGLVSSMVTKISTIEARGYYAPLTSCGTVVVDGVLASCYAQFDSHRLAQMGMTGARLAYYYAPGWLQSYLLGADSDGLMTYAKHLTPLVEFFMGSRFYDGHV